MQEKSEKVILINGNLMKFTNEKTGEIKFYTKIIYGRPIQETDTFAGCQLYECHVAGNVLDKLNSVLYKPGQALLLEKPLEYNGISKGSKIYLKQFENIKF